MKRRLFLSSAILASVAVIITSIFVTAAAHRIFQASMEREVAAEASYLCAGLTLYGEDYLNRITLKPGHRITLIDPSGTVLFDSRSKPSEMENHSNRPEVQAAVQNGTGEVTRVSDTLREQTYYYAMRMPDGSVFRMASSTNSLLAAYDELFWLVVVIAVSGCLLAAFLSLLFTRKIVSPLRSIDLDSPDNSPSYEELTPLLTRIKHQKNQISLQKQELNEQRVQFAAITEHMNEGLLVLDREGMVLSCNKSALRLLSIPATSPEGLHILNLNRSQHFREAIQRAMQGESVDDVLALDGRYCQLFVSPVCVDETMLGIILILLDVTERQEHEKLRREFTANVSHELKTPLTAISGYAELMMNGLARPEDVPEFSHSIYQESQRLIALVRDLMFLSRLEEGVAPPKERVNLLHLARRVVEALAPKAKQLGIGVSISGEALELEGISSVLQEMLYNLLDNAIQYSRPGGQAEISISREGESVLLRVSDTGIGIPKTEQNRVFERFYRVDKSHNKMIEGTGLGLAIVKHGAALHHAELELSSNEHGTSFTLRFAEGSHF